MGWNDWNSREERINFHKGIKPKPTVVFKGKEYRDWEDNYDSCKYYISHCKTCGKEILIEDYRDETVGCKTHTKHIIDSYCNCEEEY